MYDIDPTSVITPIFFSGMNTFLVLDSADRSSFVDDSCQVSQTEGTNMIAGIILVDARKRNAICINTFRIIFLLCFVLMFKYDCMFIINLTVLVWIIHPFYKLWLKSHWNFRDTILDNMNIYMDGTWLCSQWNNSRQESFLLYSCLILKAVSIW